MVVIIHGNRHNPPELAGYRTCTVLPRGRPQLPFGMVCPVIIPVPIINFHGYPFQTRRNDSCRRTADISDISIYFITHDSCFAQQCVMHRPAHLPCQPLRVILTVDKNCVCRRRHRKREQCPQQQALHGARGLDGIGSECQTGPSTTAAILVVELVIGKRMRILVSAMTFQQAGTSIILINPRCRFRTIGIADIPSCNIIKDGIVLIGPGSSVGNLHR